MSELIYNSADTICAISTPTGSGGIGVIRLSGPQAFEVAARVWGGKALDAVGSHTAHLGNILANDGSVLDQGVAVVFRGPKSYTGDDTIEFSVHGSRWIQREVLQSLIAAGARLALPGEFTRRAYKAGHLDLAQAEGVADLIAANDRAAHRAALSQMRGGISRKLEELRGQLVHLASLLELELDFSDQEVEFAPRDELIRLATEVDDTLRRLLGSFNTGAAIKNGFPVVLMGAVNAGKSALLNALVDEDRAIVSDIPGTTRDIVEDCREVGDFTVRFLDTAGLRNTADTIEKLGIERTQRAAAQASIVLYVVDGSMNVSGHEVREALAKVEKGRVIAVINKVDLCDENQVDAVRKTISSVLGEDNIITASATKGINIEGILAAIEDKISTLTDCGDDVLITTARHAEALANAVESNQRTIDALRAAIPEDLVAQELRETIHHLSTITGTIATTEILNTIFREFCIGK